jgi:hypothetical protein
MANENARSYPKGLREIRYPSNDIIHRYTSKDYTGEIRLNNETGLFEFNPPLEGTGGSSSGTTFAVNQVGHGFTTREPIYHNGTEFLPANSASDTTLGMWTVTEVTSANDFVAAQSGRFTEAGHGMTPGQFYFVSEVDGGLTSTEPETNSNPIIYVESIDVYHVLPYRPSTTVGGSGGGGSVASVFGRTGIVVAESGDYTKDQIGLSNVLNLEQIPTSEKAAVNGVATLDGGGKVPIAQIPVELQGGITVIGFWEADLNEPDLSVLALNQGQAYQVTEATTWTNLNGITDWGIGDLAVWSDTIPGNWFKLVSSTTVLSVNSKTGAVVLDSDDIAEGVNNEYHTSARVSSNVDVLANTAKVSADGSINTHSDVDTVTIAPTSGQPLVWDGSNFTPQYIQGVLPTGIQGDVLYNNGADWVPLNAGTAGYVLSTNGAGANPSWIEAGGGASETEIVAPTTWDGLQYDIDLSIPKQYTRIVDDTIDTLIFGLTFPVDAATMQREVSVIVDNATTNTLAISTMSFVGGTWNWSVGDPISGIPVGGTMELVVKNINGTAVKALTDVEA